MKLSGAEMGTPVRLGLYGLVLVVVFAVAGVTANAVVPEETVQSWVEDTENDHTGEAHMDSGDHEGHGTDASSLGLAIAQQGYQLTGVSAPETVGTESELSLAVMGPDQNPVTDFDLDHEKEMHLIAVRSDGRHFRHVHPELDEDGTWSIPWEWEAAGSYRLFADFVPSETGEGMTLSTSVQVGGDYEPESAEPTATTTVDDFEVDVQGDLVAGESSQLTMTIARDGEPVTELEPYLGAFGHLVALRAGDLAYLHVHPHGDAPEAGQASGPEIVFEATAPTQGRYLLYLDFQVQGQVYTAPLVLDTVGTGEGSGGEPSGGDSGTGGQHEEGEGHDH